MIEKRLFGAVKGHREHIADHTGRLYSDNEVANLLNTIYDENEQLKQDNAGLMKLLENRSIIIQKLHSKLLEFELKEPIILTKEDLELMDKAISYYTHGGYGE